MTASPILNPELPYVGEIEGGITPGKMVKIQGNVPSDSSRFAINYQLGPNLNPRDDIAIHVSPRFREGFVTRNHIESMSWGPEENEGSMPIQPGSQFEIIILCEYNCYKIAINGRHFTEFVHRLPYSKVTHLTIDGEVEITSVFYETINIGPRPSAPVPDVPPVNVGPPPPGGLYPTLNPQDFPNPQDKYGPPPDYRNNPPRAQAYHQKSEEEDAFGNCLDKVGLAVGGLVAAGGVAAAMHAYNKNKKKHQQESDEQHEKTEHTENESGLNLGALGAALASSLASGAFDRNAHAQQGYPSQDSGSGMLGSILGALGGGGAHPQGGYQQPAPPQPDPLGGLGSILGGVLGGSGHQQQPQYQPSGGYSGPSYQQNQGSQSGGGGDLLSGLGGALFSAAMDGLSKKSHKSQPHYGGGDQDYNSSHYNPPPPSRSDHDAPSYAPPRPPSPPAPGGGKLSAADISKGLGLGDDAD